MNKKVLTYIAVTIFSLVLLLFWNRYAIDGAEIFAHSAMSESARICRRRERNTVRRFYKYASHMQSRNPERQEQRQYS